jgi:TonB-dependent SusC/RagA subfamily outer membrane receptor
MKKTILLAGLLICLLSGFNKVQAQSAIIKGKILDSMTKETLMAVNIVEIDKNGRFISGTVTDINGNYVLKVSDVNNQVQVSFIGYKKQTFSIDGRTTIDIILETESVAVGDVVVTGTKVGNDGLTNVRDRATAVTRLELKGMETVMGTSVEDMLQGRLGNVDISSVSGDPGAGLNIRIRGTASLNARNKPLIVINGIPYDANIDDSFDFGSADIEKFGNLIDVSPEDIESIEVLKDAASTAVWGSRASNGVLMIKTKRGPNQNLFLNTHLNQLQRTNPIQFQCSTEQVMRDLLLKNIITLLTTLSLLPMEYLTRGLQMKLLLILNSRNTTTIRRIQTGLRKLPG